MSKKNNLRRMLGVLALLVVVCVASIGGTVAWLTDSTGSVTNTFTESDVDIDLTETTGLTESTGKSYKMVPGQAIAKDPTVTVKADSEACWVFVKVVKENNFDGFMSYEIADGWEPLDAANHPGVYYREVEDTDADQDFAVLENNQVVVSTEVTKADMDDLTTAKYPKLSFTGYAIQKASFKTAALAWAELNPSSSGT